MILVGSVATSKRFHNQLIDAVTSLKVGYPEDPASQMGPIIEPANGKLLNALTTLGEGESLGRRAASSWTTPASSGARASAPASGAAPTSTSPSSSARSWAS